MRKKLLRARAGTSPTAGISEDAGVQATLLLRNPLLEPRVGILELIFGNFGGPFWLILADSGASGRQAMIPDDLMDLGTQNESSGACLRPNVGHFRRKVNEF